MRDTSNTALATIEFSGKAQIQRALIFNYLKQKKQATRREIARDLQLETSTVSARVNTLRDVDNLVTDHKTTICPVSRKTVHLVEVV